MRLMQLRCVRLLRIVLLPHRWKQQGGEDAALLKACFVLPLTDKKYAPRPWREAQEVGKAVVWITINLGLGRDA